MMTKQTKKELIKRLSELLSKDDISFTEIERGDTFIHGNYFHTTDFNTNHARVQEVVDIITALYEAKGITNPDVIKFNFQGNNTIKIGKRTRFIASLQ